MRDEMNAADALPDVRRKHPGAVFTVRCCTISRLRAKSSPEAGFFFDNQSFGAEGAASLWIAMAAMRQTPRIIG